MPSAKPVIAFRLAPWRRFRLIARGLLAPGRVLAKSADSDKAFCKTAYPRARAKSWPTEGKMGAAGVFASEREKEEWVLRRISRRFLWFLFILRVINFLDRTNIGFAALTMNRDLGLSASVFGIAVSVFSVGYMLFEIPSDLILARVGARTWLSRIVFTWGLLACGCALVVGATSLITLRMLLGIAEAGFLPGLLLYMTYWFPQYYRARAQVAFLIAQPTANIIGPLSSGAIMGMDGTLGIAGWRWLFLLQGLPAVILGVVAFFYLTDRPASATWLSAEEKSTLATLLERDVAARDRARMAHPASSIARQILNRNVILLAVTFSTMVSNFSALAIWLPQIVRGMTGSGAPYWQVGLIAAIPPFCTLCVIPLWSSRSDRRKERYWHCIGPLMVAVAGWGLAASTDFPMLQILGLTIASVASISAWPVFLTIPSLVMAREAHPAGIAFVTTIGLAGAVYSPVIVGTIKDLTGSFAGSLAVVGILLAIGAGLMLLVPRNLLAPHGDEAADEIAAQPAP
jgi:ACS family 4-hydroxyphenylacetate permease-like MFS transporter